MPAANTTAEHLAAARADFAVARSMHRNLRLKRYEGRNGGGDSTLRIESATAHARELPRALEGLVWAEHRLAERISENNDMGQPRPELRARMTGMRRELRAAVTS